MIGGRAMKRKIIALILMLALIPGLTFAEFIMPGTRTEKVSHLVNDVSVDGADVFDTLKIGNKTYVETNSLAKALGKSHSVDKKGNISLYQKLRLSGFRESKWGDTKEKVISIYGKPHSEIGNTIGYFNDTCYVKSCAIWFDFNNNSLVRGSLSYTTTYENCIREYEELVKALYDDFGFMVLKNAYLPDNCPTNISLAEAIKSYGAYAFAEFECEHDSARIELNYSEVFKTYFITIDIQPK
jgi:hypothetical protein